MSSSLTNIKLPSDLTISDLTSGVRHFFERLIPRFAQKRTWQEYRQIVQKPKTCHILIQNMTNLRRVYSQWSEIVNNKRRFTIEHCIKLFEYIRHVAKKHPLSKTLVYTDDNLKRCWGLSKITVKDMNRDFDRAKHMVFVEFLEFLCRMAQYCSFIEQVHRSALSKFDSSAGEDDATFRRAEVSQGSGAEESREELRYLQVDTDSSEDDNFAYSEEHTQALTNFKFLFHRSEIRGTGKKQRLKLKWLLSLLPAVLKKRARQILNEESTIKSTPATTI